MKTKQQSLAEIQNYLQKTSKNLFTNQINDNKKDYIFKYIPLSDGIHYAEFRLHANGNVEILTNAIIPTYYGDGDDFSNRLNIIKTWLFPNIDGVCKIKSIPHFKKIKTILNMIDGKITTSKDENNKLLITIKDYLKNVETIKK